MGTKMSNSAKQFNAEQKTKNNLSKRLRHLFSVFKTDDNIIIFESTDDFSDSSKALYDYLLKAHRPYKIYWAVSDIKRAKASHPEAKVFALDRHHHQLFSYLNGLRLRAKAKYTFYTHRFIGNEFKQNQVRVFITHASPPVKNSSGFFWPADLNTYILSTSDFASKYRSLTLSGGMDRMLVTGLPRNDLLFHPNKKAIFKKLKISTAKVIVWMPTFKHHANKKRDDFNGTTDNDISILTADNIAKLQKALKSKNVTLIVKPHPSQDMDALHITETENIKILTNADLAKHHIHAYELLGASDALITDFSSVYFDYLLINKPVAFELADKATYEKGVGFIFERALDYMPGHKIYNIKDFVNFISDISLGRDPYKKERTELLKLSHKYPDGHSTERVLKHFKLID